MKPSEAKKIIFENNCLEFCGDDIDKKLCEHCEINVAIKAIEEFIKKGENE